MVTTMAESRNLRFLMMTVVVAVFTSAIPRGALSQSPTAREDLALVGGTIYVSPMSEPIRNGVVLVHDGKISAIGAREALRVPTGFQTLDCSGRTITAGFWNSHVHFFERKWADATGITAQELATQLQEMFTQYGFTNVFDTGSPWNNTRRIRDRIESGELLGPRIRSTGEPLIAPGAMPADDVLRSLGDMVFAIREITSASEAASASKELLQAGVDAIKVHLQPPRSPRATFPQDAIAAAVLEAHRLGKPVFVHPNNGADVLNAAMAGVDVIAHTTPLSGPWDANTLMAMKSRNVALTPTLLGWKSALRHDRVSTQRRLTDTAVGQLRSWVALEGVVLFGTDAGAVDYDPTEEYVLMRQAGMSFRQILASLTTNPAERFGESARQGRLAVGLNADLVVFKGDPATDVRVFARVLYTVRDGEVLYRASE